MAVHSRRRLRLYVSHFSLLFSVLYRTFRFSVFTWQTNCSVGLKFLIPCESIAIVITSQLKRTNLEARLNNAFEFRANSLQRFCVICLYFVRNNLIIFDQSFGFGIALRVRLQEIMNSSHRWGYTQENGPDKWFMEFPQATGMRQSPVDINTGICKRGRELPPLKWRYVPEHTKSLVNPGYCWRVDVDGTQSQLTGGPLFDNVYKLEQFHCHWGCENGKGSEHTVDGVSYAGELHLVHWNTSKYNSFSEAASAPDGLAVLGVFLTPGEHNSEMNRITDLLRFIKHKGDRVTLPYGCDPAKLLPSVTTYWTYEGSLTTPPCSECVIWIVFKTPIEVSNDQLEAMRDLNCYDVKEECPCNELNGKVINNFRPPLPLGNRELREFGEH